MRLQPSMPAGWWPCLNNYDLKVTSMRSQRKRTVATTRNRKLFFEKLDDRLALASFLGLGDLPGGDFGSGAIDVSADGKVIVGQGTAENGPEGFRWTKETGLVSIGTIFPTSVSADGLVVAGGAIGAGFGAARWDTAGGIHFLGQLPCAGCGFSFSRADDVSGDGAVIVGESSITQGDTGAFKWTESTGVTFVGDLPGRRVRSQASAISSDGQVIVGTSESDLGTQAFRWTQPTGIARVDFGDNVSSVDVADVSIDGSVVVGDGIIDTGDLFIKETIRWTSAGPVRLGDLAGGFVWSSAIATSGDGSIIVGIGDTDGNQDTPFYWDTAGGMRPLRQVLENELGLDVNGWTELTAQEISDDGLTLVGDGVNPNGDVEAWVAFLGDDQPDIAMLSAQLQDASTVQFTYETTGSPGTFQVGLYRSADGATFNSADLVGSLKTVTPVPTNPQTPGILTLPASYTHLPSKPYLLVVADASSVIAESNENNNSKSVLLPDIDVFSATTNDPAHVTFGYRIVASDITSPFEVAIYRSADSNFDANTDTLVAVQTISGLDDSGIGIGLVGSHMETIDLNGQLLGIDPAHPYMFVIADPSKQLIETNESNNSAFFRKRVLGVVTHGLIPFGADQTAEWVDRMASTLETNAGYDDSIAFNWTNRSTLPIPGMAVSAGLDLAEEVRLKNNSFNFVWPDDVIDVHFIGHSRGAVVINQALYALNSDPDLLRGSNKMTMLDPHPAHNELPALFSFNAGVGGLLAAAGVIAFQDLAFDPDVVIPSIVSEAQVFYQHTDHADTPNVREQILNLWGDNTIATDPAFVGSYEEYNLTGPGIGHSEIHEWYQMFVAPRLGFGNPTLPSLPLQATFVIHSPVALLIVDPLGRRIGYDPTTNSMVNDFGSLGIDSGANSEPQALSLAMGCVIPGEYQVTGIGTGSGPYEIELRIVSQANPSQPVVDRIIARGIASPGEAIAEVESIDVTSSGLHPTNTPPIILPIGTESTEEGNALTVAIQASDLDFGQSLSFSLDSAPEGATIDAATGLFMWKPSDGQATVQVTVRVTDNGSPTSIGTQSFFIMVNNVAPTVDGGPDAIIRRGGTFTGSGSFADPAADTWTATVNYGDGSGNQPLALSTDKTFSLNHIYMRSGTFTVTVTVKDDDGDIGTDTVNVRVISQQDQIRFLVADVSALLGAQALNRGRARSLTAKLEAASKQLDQGVIHAAINQLQAFSHEVTAFIRAGVLSNGQGQPLLRRADDIIVAILCRQQVVAPHGSQGDSRDCDRPPITDDSLWNGWNIEDNLFERLDSHHAALLSLLALNLHKATIGSTR